MRLYTFFFSYFWTLTVNIFVIFLTVGMNLLFKCWFDIFEHIRAKKFIPKNNYIFFLILKRLFATSPFDGVTLHTHCFMRIESLHRRKNCFYKKLPNSLGKFKNSFASMGYCATDYCILFEHWILGKTKILHCLVFRHKCNRSFLFKEKRALKLNKCVKSPKIWFWASSK